MNAQWPCKSCVFYPPSSTDGKPCCCCDVDVPMLNCHYEQDKTVSNKIIFLDVDGVINPLPNQAENFILKRSYDTMTFDADCMRNLQELVARTDALLVLSSDWRFPDQKTKDTSHMDNLSKQLASFGLVLYDCTGQAMADRNAGIDEWLKKHPWVESYAILDDVNGNFGGDNLQRLVLTDKYVGLTENDVAKAWNILNQNRVMN